MRREWLIGILIATFSLITLGVVAVLSFPEADAQAVAVSGLSGPPQPASAVSPAEMVGGQIGAMDRYAREDHTHPRITRSMIVTTQSGGTFSGTWSTPLSSAPAVFLTPVSSSASIDCQLTAAPTANGFQGRCFTAQTTTLNLSIVTAGLTLNPVANTASGVEVHVIAVPRTQ